VNILTEAELQAKTCKDTEEYLAELRAEGMRLLVLGREADSMYGKAWVERKHAQLVAVRGNYICIETVEPVMVANQTAERLIMDDIALYEDASLRKKAVDSAIEECKPILEAKESESDITRTGEDSE